jgi:CRP-like cAMP-binding protein
MEAIVSGYYLAHLSALLLVAAALQRRPRIIRLLTTLAGVAALAHFALAGAGFAWVFWSGLFTAINAVHFAALAMRARSGKLLEEERELFDEVMKIGEPGQQRHLQDLIDWRDIASGQAIVSQGQANPPLVYVARGVAEIAVDGRRVGECAPGDFLGEMSLISGQTATATVTAAEPMRVARFDREGLAQLSRAAPEVGRALDSALNRSLAAKVLRMNAVAAARGEAVVP